jgi:hypothetical protein
MNWFSPPSGLFFELARHSLPGTERWKTIVRLGRRVGADAALRAGVEMRDEFGE